MYVHAIVIQRLSQMVGILRGSPIIAIGTKGDDSLIKALGNSVTNLTYIRTPRESSYQSPESLQQVIDNKVPHFTSH